MLILLPPYVDPLSVAKRSIFLFPIGYLKNWSSNIHKSNIRFFKKVEETNAFHTGLTVLHTAPTTEWALSGLFSMVPKQSFRLRSQVPIFTVQPGALAPGSVNARHSVLSPRTLDRVPPRPDRPPAHRPGRPAKAGKDAVSGA